MTNLNYVISKEIRSCFKGKDKNILFCFEIERQDNCIVVALESNFNSNDDLYKIMKDKLQAIKELKNFKLFIAELTGQINLYTYVHSFYPDFKIIKSKSSNSVYLLSSIRNMSIRISDHNNSAWTESYDFIKRFYTIELKKSKIRKISYTQVSTKIIKKINSLILLEGTNYEFIQKVDEFYG